MDPPHPSYFSKACILTAKHCHLLEEHNELSSYKMEDLNAQTQNSAGLSLEHLNDFSGHQNNGKATSAILMLLRPARNSTSQSRWSSPLMAILQCENLCFSDEKLDSQN